MDAPASTVQITAAELLAGDVIYIPYAAEWRTVAEAGEPIDFGNLIGSRYIGFPTDDPDEFLTAWYDLEEDVTVAIPRPTVVVSFDDTLAVSLHPAGRAVTA